MNQRELNQEVAGKTGETVATIRRIGFQIADPSEPLSGPDDEMIDPYVSDWNATAIAGPAAIASEAAHAVPVS